MWGLSGIRMHICPSINKGMCVCVCVCMCVCVCPSENNIWCYPHATHLQPVRPCGSASQHFGSTFPSGSLQQNLYLIITSCPSPGERMIRFSPKTFLELWNAHRQSWRESNFSPLLVSTSPGSMKNEHQSDLAVWLIEMFWFWYLNPRGCYIIDALEYTSCSLFMDVCYLWSKKIVRLHTGVGT